MTEHKFTAEEIKKALECLSSGFTFCDPKCLYSNDCHCQVALSRDALDLINRYEAEIEKLTSGATVKAVGGIAELIEKQQAEIDRLNKEVETEIDKLNAEKNDVMYYKDQIKSEAIKGFAEKLTHTLVINNEENTEYFDFAYTLETIDAVKKEMMEEQK